jgi:hypothetical protein
MKSECPRTVRLESVDQGKQTLVGAALTFQTLSGESRVGIRSKFCGTRMIILESQSRRGDNSDIAIPGGYSFVVQSTR